MNVLTNNDVFYDVKGKKKKEKKQKPAGGFRQRVQDIKNNPLFQTAAGAYGSYLQQKYQTGNVDVSAGGQQPVVSGEFTPPAAGEVKKEPMSRTTKIAIGVGIAALIGVAVFFIMKNKNKKKIKK
jgi:hypothetical protein